MLDRNHTFAHFERFAHWHCQKLTNAPSKMATMMEQDEYQALAAGQEERNAAARVRAFPRVKRRWSPFRCLL